eukprot:3354594-Pyramimonas_sp.AAC.1
MPAVCATAPARWRRFRGCCLCQWGSGGQHVDALADCIRAAVLAPAYSKAVSRRAELCMELRDFPQVHTRSSSTVCGCTVYSELYRTILDRIVYHSTS